MDSDKISVIVPVYNEEQYLKDCVNSIRNQSYQNIELILVDDGSTNMAGKICDELASADGRIKVLHKKNGGLSDAREAGLAKADGQWIMFVDNDDIIAQNLIEEFMRYSGIKEVDIIAGGRVDSTEVQSCWMSKVQAPSFIDTGRNICERMSEGNTAEIITPLWGKLYRSEFIKNLPIHKYKERCPTIYFEDILVTPLIYYHAEKICIVLAPYYIHREVKTSISRSGKLSSFYYEQIYSGDIKLGFLEEAGLQKLYVYELRNYIDVILRLWCLMDSSKYDKYRRDIKRYYRKYILCYLGCDGISFFKKLSRGLFLFSPVLFKFLANVVYFNYRKDS